MSLLVTGGHGFVMSNLARLWLDRHPHERVTILDRDHPDEAARRFFAGVEDRIRWIAADILDPGAWHDEARRHGVARALLLAAADFARADGALRLELETDHDNANAQALYRAMGWTPYDGTLRFRLPL